MPHAGSPRAVKRRQAAANAATTAAATPMVSKNVVTGPWGRRQRGINRRANEVPNMDQMAIMEVNNLIDRRFESAEQQTNFQAQRMEELEKMYNAEWANKEHDEEEHVFLAKGREALQVVGAFMFGMVMQLPKLVEFLPAPTRLNQMQGMWRSAKLSESLVNHYFEDRWNFRNTILRDFIKTFLKFPTALIRVDYLETESDPDLRFTVVDRALQYIDPHAHTVKEAKWWIEKEFWPRAEVEAMFEKGHWHRPREMPDMVPTLLSSSTSDVVLRRFFGGNYNSNVPVEADDQVEVWKYRQRRTIGIEDRYAVRIGGLGGWLVRYGSNPFPGPDIPYCGDSFDRHEWQVDGKGLLEMHEALQEIINTVLNLRLDDLREGNWSPTLVPEELITQQTKDDLEDRQKLVRVNGDLVKAFLEKGGRLESLFAKLPVNDKESMHLYQDLGFLLGQSNEAGHSSDVFRGQTPSKVTTAQEIQEALTSNQGAFKPAFMGVMQVVEDVAAIAAEYLRNPDFFGEERVLIATGGRYADVVKQWDFEEDDVRAAAVTFDDMSVNVTISAVNGADAMLSRTFRAAVVKEMLASIGQVDGMFDELRDRFDFVPLIIELFRSAVSDVDKFERSPAEVTKIREERGQQNQQKMAQQVEIESLSARATEQARSEREVTSIQTRATADAAKTSAKQSQEHENKLEEILAKSRADTRSDIALAFQEHANKIAQMREEQRLEIEALKQGLNSQVGPGQGEVKTSQ